MIVECKDVKHIEKKPPKPDEGMRFESDTPQHGTRMRDHSDSPSSVRPACRCVPTLTEYSQARGEATCIRRPMDNKTT